MSRLDSAIRRLRAQRRCLNEAARLIDGRPGVVLEFGLGNGRTYDHLREILPAREIYVFERAVAAHPDCVPPPERLFLGDVGDTLPRAAAALGGRAVLVHSDIGTGDGTYNRAVAALLAEGLPPLLAPGAVLVSDQTLPLPPDRAETLPPPDGVPPGRYAMMRWAG